MNSFEPLKRLRNGIFSSNTYVYSLPNRVRECFVIDPGLDFELIDSYLVANQLTPVAVFCTHGHFDHVGSAQNLKEKYQCQIYLHEADVKLSKSANFLLMACKLSHRIRTPLIDVLMSADQSALEVAGVRVSWAHVPGHTPGSCLIFIEDMVFSGDTIYKKAVGLSDFPGEDRALLIQSILKMWDKIPSEFVVYPGHGGSGSFGSIKELNLPLRKLLGFLDGAIEQESLQGSLNDE